MLPTLAIEFATNLYITVALIYGGALGVALSPIIGNIILLACFILLVKGQLRAKQAFLISSYAVALEVIIHTHFIGWDAGFYFYLYLMPIIFLVDSSWRLSTVLVFNGSIIVLTVILWYYYHGETGSILQDYTGYLHQINIGLTAIFILTIMVYFSHTVNKKDKNLVEANAVLERQNKEISEQHHHLEILLKEVHHRVKNNLQIISSLMSLQKRAVEDKDVENVLNESKRRVEAIALIHQKLYLDDNVANQVDFKSYLEDLINSQQAMIPHVECRLSADEINLNLDIAVPLGLIISEMITNSIKHAFEAIRAPKLVVILKHHKGKCELVVQDNGIGLPNDFEITKPRTFGIEIITALADQIDAELDYLNDNGAIFKLTFRIEG